MTSIQGIYLIERTTNKEGERYYVGLSVDIFERWKQHCCVIKPEQNIDKALRENGVNNFSFSILEIVEHEEYLKARESDWIKTYRKKYTDQLLYNRSETTNQDPLRDVRAKIRELLRADITQSIYAIADKFSVSWKVVVKVRKPMLRREGLMFENGLIVNADTHQPPGNWNGGRLTKRLADIVKDECNKGTKAATIARKYNISKSDVELFINETDWDNYTYAPSI